MGKYMRKGKGVGKMEVSQGSLGVRTRARSALALEKEKASKFSLHHTTTTTTSSSSKASESSQTLPPESQRHYMELRSRRLEKVARCEKEKERDSAEEHDVAQASARELQWQRKNSSGSRLSSPRAELHTFDEESSRMRLQNSSSSKQDFSLLAAGSDAIKYTRLPPPDQSSVKGSGLSKPVAPTASSTQSLSYSDVSIPPTRPLVIFTRNQRQELACSLVNQEAMEVDTGAVGPSGNIQRPMEDIEPCFGESPMIAGPSSKDRQYGPNTRRRTRECTPDSFIREVEAPGSTSARTRRTSQDLVRSLSAPPFGRSNDAPSSREIDAFFARAEQQERRRFIDRYNFDPLTESPLRGRYEWLNM